MYAHVRPAAWVALCCLLGAIDALGTLLGPSLGDAFARLMESLSPLFVFLLVGALLGLIIGLIGRWGTVYELSNEP
jgi:hypothetical protein